MIIVALVATLAGSMVWQQWRAIQVEAAERARTQSAWILSGALDWARLILREDARDRRHRPPRRALGGAAGRSAALDLPRRRQGQHRGCARRLPVRRDHRRAVRATTCATWSRAARSIRPSSPRCSGCARPSASRSTSRRASRPACATRRRRRRPTRARAAPARSRPRRRPPTRRSCRARRRSWPGSASIPVRCERSSPTSCSCPSATFGQRQHRAARGARRRDRRARPRRRPSASCSRASGCRSSRRADLQGAGAGAAGRPASTGSRLGSSFFEVRGRLRLGDVVLEQRSLVQRRGRRRSWCCSASASPRATA